MDWQHLRQSKGQSVQEFTQVFRKKALALDIPLNTRETLLKYIGSLHSYLRHTLLMFNPTDFDEVCVQAIHIESGGRPFHSNFSKKPFKQYETKDTKMVKGKGKGQKNTIVKKEGERPTCTHCQREGHEESICWKLHPELKPKKFSKKKKGENKTNAAVQ